MAAVIGILLTHEMGHFIQTVRYRVPASLPFFIPVPLLLTGTMGAVIGMEGSRADRKQLFDIGISGPLGRADRGAADHLVRHQERHA